MDLLGSYQTAPDTQDENWVDEIMAEVLKGWHPDPFGIHELRYFSMDGRPSRLVRDDGVQSSDPPPENMPFLAPNDPSNLPLVSAPGPTGSTDTSLQPALHGWHRDRDGRHQERYFTRGEPTSLVRDSGVESYDEPTTEHSAASRRSETTLPPTDERTQAGSGSQTFNNAQQGLPRSANNGTSATSSNEVPIESLPSHSVSPHNGWRKVLLVVVVAAGLAAGVVSLILSTTHSNSPSSTCSLLTRAQVHGLLGQPGRIVEDSLRPHANGCDYSSPRPHSPATDILVTLRQRPKDFPTSDILQRGKVVKLDGQATYFVPGPTTPPIPVRRSIRQHFLLAVKDGHEVSIQVTARMPQQEAIARRAMSLILPQL
jgi:hypothetical protein